MRRWLVAGAVIESDEGLLLVRNLRRNGTSDWTPPGGVIEDHEAHAIRDGLAREVQEESGLTVTAWGPMLYEVEARAPGLGWIMHAQVWLAAAVANPISVGNDPDGNVTAAEYVPHAVCAEYLATTHDWVREPLLEWLEHRWEASRTFRYELVDTESGSGRIVRLDDGPS